MSLIGCLLVPLFGLFFVEWNTTAFLIHLSEIELGTSVILLRCLTIPFNGFLPVSCKRTLMIHLSKFELGFRVIFIND